MSARRPLGSAACIAAAAVLALYGRGRLLRFGATRSEQEARLPGDDLVPGADVIATRAISIAAPLATVWPWIAQLGQGRGGFYSYCGLENLVGCNMQNADRIVADWQDIAVGDAVRLHPDVSLSVAELEPGHALVLRGGIPMGPVAAPYDFTWAFVVRAGPDGSTRLVVRERYGYTRWWSAALVEPVELVSFVMSRRMLRGVRQRAQAQHEPLSA